jgi:hypothetical protein
MSDALSASERQELESLEAAIQAGLRQFEAVGRALLRIRDAKLYRSGYRRFEDYLRERWKFGKAHAFRLITAAEVAESLQIGDKPANEGQARALAGAPAMDRPGIMAEAKGGGRVSAAAIAEIIAKAKVTNPCPPAPPDPKAERMRQITSLVARLRSLHAGIPDVAERCDRILGDYLEALLEAAC